MKNRALRYKRRQRGSSAIELAAVLPVFVLLLAFTAFFGRFFWHYTVAQKAAHDAALILASSTKLEIATSNNALSEVEVAKLAKTVATAAIVELNPGGSAPLVEVYCDSLLCIGDGVPQNVQVAIRMKVSDTLFAGFTSEIFQNTYLWVRADVRVPYVGN